jgi:putative membrane-bound dehydrogenase-like protein
LEFSIQTRSSDNSPQKPGEAILKIIEARRRGAKIFGIQKTLRVALALAALNITESRNLNSAEPKVTEADLPRVPATPPDKALSTFKIKEGFKIELVASEPLVVDPIALCFDEDSRMFVVEMRDYSERRDERLGRIKMLEDTDGDGRMDRATIFAEDLPWPTAVFYYNGGLFVGSTPDIYYLKDTNGDGKADEKKTVFTGFGSGVKRLNVQQLFNSFNWSFDNRIHGASGGNGGVVICPEHPNYPSVNLRNSDFSFDPKTLEMRAESGGGQYGMSFDAAGHKFVCSNSSHIREVMYERRYLTADMSYPMSPAALDIPVDGPAAEVFRISPDEPWRVIRTRWRVAGLVPGPIEGGGRPSGYFTGATGLTIYRGDALGDDVFGNAFIGDAGSNLVHRKKLKSNGVPYLAERPGDEKKREFLACTDNWFRPVQMANAPDGALYICDMYREIIEHPWSLPPNLKKHLDLNSGNDRGRIYRIVPTGFTQPKPAKLSAAGTEQLVDYLAHPNGWQRETASRLLSERHDKAAIEPLRYLLRTTHSVPAQIYSLYALADLGALSPEDLQIGFQSPYSNLRENAVRVSERVPLDRQIFAAYQKLAEDSEPRVRYQLTWTLSTRREVNIAPLLVKLAAKAVGSWEQDALLAVLSRDPARFFRVASGNLDSEFMSKAAYLDGLKGDLGATAAALTYLVNLSNPERQLPPTASLLRGLHKASPSMIPSTIRELDECAKFAATVFQAKKDSPELEDAVVVMAPDYSPANRDKILAALSPQTPPAAQVRILKAITQTSPQTAAAALKLWPRLTPSVRLAFLDAAIVQPQLIPALLNALQNGTVPVRELTPSQVVRLKLNAGFSKTVLETILGKRNQTSRAEAIKAYQPALSLAGDPAKGKMVFTNLCATCHRLNGIGNAVGPDLESVRTAGKEAIFLNILDPNREVPPRFASYEIQTKSGDDFVGILANESESGYTLKQPNARENFIPRNQVKSIRSTGKSLMPEGLEAELTPMGLASLLAYIRGE